MGNISRIKGSNQVRVKYYVNLLYALVQAFAKEKKHIIIILFSEMFPVFSL